MIALLMTLLIAASTNAYSEQIQSRTQNGFTATAALVNDPDWARQWSDQDRIVPQFKLAERIDRDQSATLLIFFSNPSRDQANIWVTCDMEIRDSRNEVVGRLNPEICVTKSPSVAVSDVYLFPDMELTTAHATRPGPMVLKIGVTDEVSKQRIELKLDIEVDKKRR